MRRTLIHILKFTLLIVFIGFLFAFAERRNELRKVKELQIEFVDEQDPYVNELTVDKLLIQNQMGVTNVGKEILALNIAENALDAHHFIEDSDIYLTVNAELRARIKQCTPIARVNALRPFYIDEKGNKVPLSESYSARVPLVSNVSEREIKELFPLLKKIKEDEFLKKHVVSISRKSKGNYEIGVRVFDFVIDFGKVELLDRKIKNFKAFYQKAIKDKSLEKYQKVSLEFKNQVVCTFK